MTYLRDGREKMDAKLNIQRVKLSQMNPAPYNPRADLQPGDPDYERIRMSLREFGYCDPLVYNEVTGNIVSGHQRYKILLAEGEEEVQCEVVHIESPEDERALNVALNEANGDWDQAALSALLQMIQSAKGSIERTGFSEDELAELIKSQEKTVRDDNTDLSAEDVQPFVQPGDIWFLGNHRMMCGDATKPEDLNRLMDGNKANLILTDPPYNVAYESADGKSIQNDSMEDHQFLTFLLAAFKNWVPHLAEGASAYVFHADTEGLNFRKAFVQAGFHLSNVCIWVKNSLVLGRSPYQWQHEPCLYGWIPNGGHKWYGDNKQSTIWQFDKPKRSKEHPTMKPIPLLAKPIQNSTAPNAIVLDTFGGSGSTLIACEQTERICYTMELDERYATVIVLRYRDLNPNGEISVLRNGERMTIDWVKG